MRALIREIIETIILSLLLFLGVQFTVQTYQVEGASMRPTLAQGQYLLVNKLVYRHFNVGGVGEYTTELAYAQPANIFPFDAPNLGDVVVFNFPHDPTRDFVKRIIGVPGDTVEIRDGQTFVNGVRLHESYVTRPDDDDMDAFTVKPNEFFVLGDNRLQSNDSRDWGAVPLEYIVGRAWVRYWPPDEIRIFSADSGATGSAAAHAAPR